jgi:hypothetical protein
MMAPFCCDGSGKNRCYTQSLKNVALAMRRSHCCEQRSGKTQTIRRKKTPTFLRGFFHYN